MYGPKREDLGGLEQADYAVWIRTLAAECALTARGNLVQTRLVKLLDLAPERGPWCDHGDCALIRDAALAGVLRGLWKTPSA